MKENRILIFSIVILLFFTTLVFGQNNLIDKVKYEIWVELDHQNKMLHGREIIKWLNDTNDEISDFWFHLYWNAFKNEKSAVIEESREGHFFRIKIKDGEWGWIDVKKIRITNGPDLTPTIQFIPIDKPLRANDQTVMRILLPEPLKPGEEISFELIFEAKIPRTVLRAGYYHNAYFIAQWFPKPGVYEEGKGWNCHQYHLTSEFYADFAEFTVHITVPKEFVIGASGKLISTKENKKERTITYTYWQNHIHDFAWTADPDYIKIERDFIADQEVSPEEYKELSKILNLPIEKIKLKNVKMILLINPEHKNQIERHFKALRTAIKYYGLWYGPYPYETITMVDPPFRSKCGGMEYPTLFTAGTNIFLSKKVLSPEGVIVHEFGHGYWYGMCANNEFEEAWLDEGINTYSTGKVLDKAYGPSVFPVRIARIPYTRYIDSIKYYNYHLDRTLAIHIVKFDPIITNSWQFYSGVSYGLNVYQRASTCLYTLERILGENIMLRILRTFQMQYRFKHPTTKDFINVVNEVSGRNMSWFFNELFFKANEFDYGISSLISKRIKTARGIFDKKDKKIEITTKKAKEMDKKIEKPQYLTIVKVKRFGEAKLGGDVKLKIKIVFKDGTKEIKYWDGKARWTEFRFIKSSKVKYAQVDPDYIFLIDANITNNSLKLKPNRTGVLRWTNKFLFWVQNFLQFISIFS
ncbi:M1 family metallopeptidase [Candidatus Aminicenantes bacterium AH-873-B07]|nr:M1 family metallopeptidase [Candidatus Aminicenantes bacterium AH-873-B07]